MTKHILLTILAFVAIARSTSAATVNLDDYINNGQVAGAFWVASLAAGDGGTIQLSPNTTYTLTSTAYLPKSVTLAGAGVGSSKIVGTNTVQYRLLVAAAADITIKDVTFVGSESVNYDLLNTGGSSGLYVENCQFLTGGAGITTHGEAPNGLTVLDCVFEDCRGAGVAFNRDWIRYPVAKAEKAPVIAGCTFGGQYEYGVTFDAGNDGSDGPRTDYPAEREIAKNTVTDLNNAIVYNNTFGKAKYFNLAIAKCQNVVIMKNTMLGGIDGSAYNQALHIEHEANSIWAIHNDMRNDSDGIYASVVTIGTFTDYGNPSLYENGCSDIVLYGNRISGSAKQGITATELRNSLFIKNKWKSPRPSDLDVNLYKSDIGSHNILFLKNRGMRTDKMSIQAKEGEEGSIIVF